jgi:hypothetical protein
MTSDINFKEKHIYLFHKMSITYTKVQEGVNMEDWKIKPVTLRMPRRTELLLYNRWFEWQLDVSNSSCIR